MYYLLMSLPNFATHSLFHHLSPFQHFFDIFWVVAILSFLHIAQHKLDITSSLRHHLFSLFCKVSQLQKSQRQVTFHDAIIKVGYTRFYVKKCKLFPAQTNNSILKMEGSWQRSLHKLCFFLDHKTIYSLFIICTLNMIS